MCKSTNQSTSTHKITLCLSVHPHLVVGADGRSLPAPVVPARVAVVQLEAVVLVPPREEERNAKGPQASELCVRLPRSQRGGGDGGKEHTHIILRKHKTLHTVSYTIATATHKGTRWAGWEMRSGVFSMVFIVAAFHHP